ncbi:hypothetical protein MUK42_20328 [Musa troglodytarum]|uniref:Uncharacterized protein n=1 Tax=Musa troglodytarum TaxID=320322 RepID=A0A9E7K8E9_9LILI|nr:hypothetical protein MUK42_20328 [Musa troglodytarum]
MEKALVCYQPNLSLLRMIIYLGFVRVADPKSFDLLNTTWGSDAGSALWGKGLGGVRVSFPLFREVRIASRYAYDGGHPPGRAPPRSIIYESPADEPCAAGVCGCAGDPQKLTSSEKEGI